MKASPRFLAELLALQTGPGARGKAAMASEAAEFAGKAAIAQELGGARGQCAIIRQGWKAADGVDRQRATAGPCGSDACPSIQASEVFWV